MALKSVPTEGDIEPLDLFDLSELDDLSPDFRKELMASAALEHMKTVVVLGFNIVGAKSVHNDAQVRDLANAEMSARVILGEIKRLYPESIALAKVLAQRAADEAKRVREAG